MYDIMMDNRTMDGDRLKTVMLRHAPHDADKIIRLRDRMITDGWQGRKVILIDCGDYHMALTGSHRLAAFAGLDYGIDALMITDAPDEFYADLDTANDDDDLLALFEACDMADAAAIMRDEIAHNNAG